MAPKHARESDESAAGGAKKPRLDKDSDDDEEMYDAPPASGDSGKAADGPAPSAAEDKADDETEIPHIELEDLDYKDLAEDLVYDNNGWIHPNYGDNLAWRPTQAQAVPEEPKREPPPKSKPKSAKKSLTSEEMDEFREKMGNLFKSVNRLHEDWIGVEGKLGSGGQGCARLFVRVDSEQKITERVVVKDSWSKFEWDDKDFWEEKRSYCDPRESITHKLLTLPTPKEWERHLVKYISHSINPTWQVSRVYMEYCEGGDLHSLKVAQKNKYRHVLTQSETDSGSAKGSGSEKDPVSVEVPAGEGVPEPFVWYFLKQMAIALHRMENIPLQRYRNDFVVHKDMKPPNIFMTNPDAREFPRYPICKIGDFGSARISQKGDYRNPLFWSDAVTFSYVPPEMDKEHVHEQKGWECSNATNVWQVARSIVALMRLEEPELINYEDEDLDEEHMDSLVDLGGVDYGDEILDLLRAMLSTDPNNRPTPKDILANFYENEYRWREMATAPSCNDFDLHSSRLHWMPNKKFQMGDFFADVPPLPKEKSVKVKKGGLVAKAKIGGLVVPTSSDEESSSSEDEDPKAGKGKLYDDGGEEEEEEEENEDKDEDDDLPDAPDEDDEAEENDYDDDPMNGSSGPSLSSGSEFRPSR